MTDVLRFNAQAIDRAIDASLARIPEGRKGAALAVLQADGTFRVAVATRLSDRWDVVVTVAKDPGQQPDGAVAVRGSW